VIDPLGNLMLRYPRDADPRLLLTIMVVLNFTVFQRHET